ncbi:hypothetical protein ACU5P1_11845 [Pseudomonas plecoglossicida]|uniref:hypothetical protein n=1 Tax=Pseudomonas plecoglossicida TaxID=70775 RepID=UPI0011828925|nr:hypothetical protein [Pseudomonas plecoglossicida]QLB55464.1 hypothetical protein HAV28_11750 [Pseudomonas plecoglossicida]
MTVPWRQFMVFYVKTVSCGADLTVATNLTVPTTVCLPDSGQNNPSGNFSNLLTSQAAQDNKPRSNLKKNSHAV